GRRGYWQLSERQVRGRLWHRIERRLLDISYHTHDGLPRLATFCPAELDVLSDGVLAGPDPMRHALADNNGQWSIRAVLSGKKPSPEQRYAQGAEKAGGNGLPHGHPHLARSGGRLPLGRVFRPVPAPTRWQAGDRSSRVDTRQGL